jgi:hypothetical protein
MKRSSFLTVAGFLALSSISVPVSRAADHRDWPNYEADITSDITDVYSWMSADSSTVYLVMDLQGADTGATSSTQFSNAVQYVFHVNSVSTYAPGTIGTHPDTIICKFGTGTPQTYQCWGPSVGASTVEYVTDSVGNTAGKSSTSGNMKVYAGYRQDPFFFNIRGFLAAATYVNGAAGSLTFDNAKCPTLAAANETVIVNDLTSNGSGTKNTGVDDFGPNGQSLLMSGNSGMTSGGMTNGNVLSIVVAINKSLLTAGGNIVSVWGSTNM